MQWDEFSYLYKYQIYLMKMLEEIASKNLPGKHIEMNFPLGKISIDL